MEKQIANEILACNKKIGQYGLSLNEQQALALAKTRSDALKENKRVEFGNSIVDKLILAFGNSPYISQEDYESTMHELIYMFYEIKNNTWDIISDCELIEFMKASFDNICCGSLELLQDELMRLTKHIHAGGRIKEFG